jgi:hypothetical protein
MEMMKEGLESGNYTCGLYKLYRYVIWLFEQKVKRGGISFGFQHVTMIRKGICSIIVMCYQNGFVIFFFGIANS